MLHRRKKLEIVVETGLLDSVLETVRRAGAKGYTVLPCEAGAGVHGAMAPGEISDALSLHLVVVVAEEALARALMEEIVGFARRHMAITMLSDVEVFRGEKF